MDLSVKFAGIEFKNPVIASSGPLGRTFMSLKKSIEAGVSAVTVKSCSALPAEVPEPKPGYLIKPRTAHKFLRKYGAPFTMYNWEAAPPEFTAEMEAEMIAKIRPIAEDHDCKIIASLNVGPEYIEDKKLYKKDLKTVLEAGPDLLEQTPCGYHFSPPPSWPLEERPERIAEIHYLGKEEAKKVNIPTIAAATGQGLMPRLSEYNLDEYKKRGIRCFHIKSGYTGTMVDIETMKPVVPGPTVYTYGALRRSGENLSTALAKAQDVELISSGGVWTTYDCIERIMCGATLVALHTAIQYRGHKLFGDIIRGTSEFLDRKGLKIDAIMGAAVPSIVDPAAHEEFMRQCDVPKESLWVEIDANKCTGCALCENCIHGAIMMKDRVPIWNSEFCELCGICESICATEAITIRRI